MATFLDDFSRLSVVVPVPSKAEVIPTVKKIINMLETQSGQKLRKVCTDRGGEYLNNELKDFYSAKGIVHQTPAPYTPEQNGKAERLNRTLMERVRAMLQDAKLPNSLWAEVVTTAIFICNRSPVCGDFKTPKELFYGDKIDVSNMKTFGARAYFHIPKAQRQKLDPVSIKGIMVGYAADSKAYRIMLDDTKKTIISRDVTFEESIGVPKDEEFQDPEDNSEDNNDDVLETEHQEDAEAEGAAPAPASTAEAEYMAASQAVKEALWLRKLTKDLGGYLKIMQMYTDNQAALTLLKNPIASARSKHIDIIYHFARERVARKEVKFDYCPTAKMIADIMTKALAEGKFVACCNGMGVQ